MAVTPGQAIVGTVDVGGNQAGSQRSNFTYGYRQLQARNKYDGTNVTEGTSSVMVNSALAARKGHNDALRR